MSSMTICARFRPLSSKERRDHGDRVCIRCIDAETFLFKDEKDEEFTFSFDKVFYEKSEQAQVYEFLAWPIVKDAVDAINGTIITYGQTGAGKTYSMEGPSILVCDEQKRGLLPRVVEGLFDCIKSSGGTMKHSIKLSMVEIYMEKVRYVEVEWLNLTQIHSLWGIKDLFDLSKDNIQIKESKSQGILLNGVTEISVSDPTEALQSLSSGIANRAVGETHIEMNMASSRSHCIYIFTVHQEVKRDDRLKTGKLILVDLAGSEKVEKTGAEGKVLEEAKTINKSLSVLGNVINALTCGSPGKANHIPFRDSKLTRILQDSLGGNSRTALLCCCSPSPSNALESLSTLRFGMRAKHIKMSPGVKCNEDKCAKKQGPASSPIKHESCEIILDKLKERFDAEDVKLLEELFTLNGILFDPCSSEELDSAFDDVISQTIVSLQQAVEELASTVDELKRENKGLKERLAAAERSHAAGKEAGDNNTSSLVHKLPGILSSFVSWVRSLSSIKLLNCEVN